MPDDQRREVLGLLDVRVTVTDAEDVGWPSVVIEGRVDPRLFGGCSGGVGLAPEPGTPTPGSDGLLVLAVEEQLGRGGAGRDGVDGDVPAAQFAGGSV